MWDKGVLPWLITDSAAKNHQVGCAPPPEEARSWAYGGPGYAFCPPIPFQDQTGFCNILMDAAFSCEETSVEPASWGAIKALFR